MNGDDQGKSSEHENDSDFSDDEEKEKRAKVVADRRAEIYKRKMEKRKAKVKGNFDFNGELGKGDKIDNKPSGDVAAAQMKFLKVKVQTRIGSSEHVVKSDNQEDLIHLVGEIEISDKLKFKELLPKSAKMFNTQLKDKGYDIVFSDSLEKSKFRFAKTNGEPDSNFPCFWEGQKVSDCGVTNICLAIDPSDIEYVKSKPGQSDTKILKAKKTELQPPVDQQPPRKTEGEKKGGLRKKETVDERRDIDKLQPENKPCKCVIF